MKQKGFAPILLLIGILVIMIVAGGAYYLGRSAAPKSSSAPITITSTPLPTIADETANWKTYKDSNFEFKYPNNFTYNNCQGVAFDLTDLVSNGSVYCAEITFPEGSYAIYLDTALPAKNIEEAIKGIRLGANKLPSSVKLTFNSNEFVKVKRISTNDTYQSFYFIKDPKTSLIYEFYLVHPNRTLSGVATNYEKILEQILSTFKFTQ